MYSRSDSSGKHGPSSHRLWFAGLVGAAALALVPLAFHAERRFETVAHIEGGEAEYVEQQLATRFRSPFVNRVVLVIQGLPPADSEEGANVLRKIVDGLRIPEVSGIVSRLDLADPIFLGRGGTFVLIGLAPTSGSVESLVPRIRERVRMLQDHLRNSYPVVKLELTGEMPLNFDLRKASSDDVRKGESLVLPATLVLLLFAFGSFVAALIPLAVGQLAISMTLGIAALLASRWNLSILVQNVAAMLGLGLGIDYALLMLSRFREALAAGHDRREASDRAARQAGHTLFISASTVGIGFAALLTVPISEIRSIGVSGLIVAGASVLLVYAIVPAVLAFLGTRVDAGALPFLRKWNPDSSAYARDRWKRWGRFITTHPWTGILLAGAPLLLLATQATRLDTDLPRGDWLPPAAESVRAFHSLEQMGRAGIVQSLRVLLELPSDSVWQSKSGWNAAARLSDRLASDPRTDRVISLATLTDGNQDAIASLSAETRRSFLRSDGHATLLELLPAPSVSPSEQMRWVRELRQTPAVDLTGVADARVRIGGIPALNADYESAVGNRLILVIALVVGGTLVALLVGFRSLFSAVKAIALNLLSVGAAFGTLVLVFQEGHGSRFLGVGEGTEGVFPIVPILTFAIVFGLSMDYEVFLVARVLEARRSGLSESEAISEGLARTAGLITSAAAIMIVVFAGFTLGDFLVIKMLGLALAVAVLIDATLVRMVIGPALLTLAGDWNWWPWGLTSASSAAGRSSLMHTNAAPAVMRERLEIRQANDADNEGLVALTRATPMSGTIALRIDRDPDFFALLRLRGDSKVYVAVCGREVVGCISAALRPSYICGVPEVTAYIGDMKVHPRFSGSRLALRLIQTLEAHLRLAGIDLCFSVVAAGNQRAIPLFAGRLGTPRWAPLGRFVVEELLPSPLERPSRRYHVQVAEKKDIPAITALLDRFHRSRQFGPQILENEVAETLSAADVLPFSKTLVARDGTRVVATLSILDTAPVKRNVLLGAPSSARAALALLRFIAAPLPGFCIPRIGQALRLLTARYFACEEGHNDALEVLVRRARLEGFRQRVSFLVLGLHERDPLRRIVRGMPRFTFSSLAFATSLGTPARLDMIAGGIPFEDYALV
jgi:putative drug exporter of the RND superfamily